MVGGGLGGRVFFFEDMSMDKPFGKLMLSGINAFIMAFISDFLEKVISTITVTSRDIFGFTIYQFALHKRDELF